MKIHSKGKKRWVHTSSGGWYKLRVVEVQWREHDDEPCYKFEINPCNIFWRYHSDVYRKNPVMSERKRRPRSSNRPLAKRKKPPECMACGASISDFVFKTEVVVLPNGSFHSTHLQCPECDWAWHSPEELADYLTNYKKYK